MNIMVILSHWLIHYWNVDDNGEFDYVSQKCLFQLNISAYSSRLSHVTVFVWCRYKISHMRLEVHFSPLENLKQVCCKNCCNFTFEWNFHFNEIAWNQFDEIVFVNVEQTALTSKCLHLIRFTEEASRSTHKSHKRWRRRQKKHRGKQMY